MVKKEFKYYCDHCKKELLPYNYLDISIKVDGARYSSDRNLWRSGLCPLCLEEFYPDLYYILGEPEILDD